jgi:cytochrome c553
MRKVLKRIGIALGGVIGIALVVGLVLALIGRSRLNGRYEVAAALPGDAVVSASAEMGARIAVTRGCTECHAEGMKGRVFLDIPPGLIVAPNLTKGRGGVGARYASPDDWNRAVRYGVRPDSSLLVPFMPYDFFNRLSEADAASVAAYLASLSPVDNELPATKLRPPGYIMNGLPNMSPSARLAELNKPRTTPAPGSTADYGRYLASTTCVGCHSENMLGGPHFDPAGKPAPGLSHVGAWSREDFVRAMRTGVAPGERQLTDWMPWKMYAMFTDDELTALHEFVKTIRPAGAGTD